jgi:hypothetical protein
VIPESSVRSGQISVIPERAKLSTDWYNGHSIPRAALKRSIMAGAIIRAYGSPGRARKDHGTLSIERVRENASAVIGEVHCRMIDLFSAGFLGH